MNHYDSDVFKIPFVPFIIQLPKLCFKVNVVLNTAAQYTHLPYFDLIENSISSSKPHGHKAHAFFAFSTGFILIGNDGYKLIYEPYGWYVERKLALDSDNKSSIDTNLATGYEAYKIYLEYQDINKKNKIKQIIKRLDNDDVSIDHIKSIMPALFDFINHSKVNIEKFGIDSLKISIANQICRSKPIKNTFDTEKFADTNLLSSYLRILTYQTGDKKTKQKPERRL